VTAFVPRPILSADPIPAATRATCVAFTASGFAFASWASRIPQVRDRLHLSPATLGLVLLAIAAGSLVSLPLAGALTNRLSSRRTVAAMSSLVGVALTFVATGYLGGVALVVIGLFVLGFANGAWDVAMNVQGAAVERRLGNAILPRFHAGFSVGTVASALAGVALVALRMPVTVHLLAVGVVVAVTVPIAARRFVEDTDPAARSAPVGAEDRPRHPLVGWSERRTLVIGVLVVAFTLAEGTGSDWASVAVIDGYHAPVAVGTLAYATFLAAMTASRWFGPVLLGRYGRVRVIRTSAAIGAVGIALFIFSPNVVIAFIGAVLWGCGASLGFPVGMSAASDDPVAAAARVSVVASIGYCGFLAGPPVIGFLGDRVTVLRALGVVGVLFALAVLVASSLRPLPIPPNSPHGGSVL
jgi:MFS family permease